MIWKLIGSCFGCAGGFCSVSVSSGISIPGFGPRQAVKMGLWFGTFQFLMPLLGWLLGSSVSQYIEAVDHWVAFGLLAIVGGKMIKEGLSAEGESVNCNDLLSLRNTLLLGVALSIDALITGFSLGMVKIRLFDGPPLGNTLLAALLIGLSAFLISAAGLKIGKRVSSRLGPKAEIFGGLILIGIGVKILIEHLS